MRASCHAACHVLLRGCVRTKYEEPLGDAAALLLHRTRPLAFLREGDDEISRSRARNRLLVCVFFL